MATQMEVRTLAERLLPGEVPLWVHPEWEARFPWLVQGTTGRGTDEEPFDLGLSGVQPVGRVLDRWRALLAATEMQTAAHARQVHQADIWIHRETGSPGILVMDGFDGHVTDRPGVLLSVGVADCVPVSVIDPETRVAALVHAGWRGTAAGIVERAINRIIESWQSAPERLWLHCGPAICGVCYEVGPEVHAAVNPNLPVPSTNTPIDVRAAIAERALGLGLPAEQVSVSEHCTRCGAPDFFSHRGGSKARQMGLLGIRDIG
ncbi:MAG TPA: laccase domain-containing protein [Longimicrobium sp.]|nr:laccase domain-containing protein [Longimicrobium sp.]